MHYKCSAESKDGILENNSEGNADDCMGNGKHIAQV